MLLSEMEAAVEEAERVIRRSQLMVRKMAPLVVGNLQNSNVDYLTLEKLKRELKNYNIHTYRWKKK